MASDNGVALKRTNLYLSEIELRAITVLAKAGNKSYAELLRENSLNELVEQYQTLRKLVLEEPQVPEEEGTPAA